MEKESMQKIYENIFNKKYNLMFCIEYFCYIMYKLFKINKLNRLRKV